MLFNNTFTSSESTTESGSFVFDYTNNGYSMGDGSPVLVTGVEAVKQFLLQMLNTTKGRYAVYPSNFGTSIKDNVVGHKFPRGYALPELRREIEESCALCPEIDTLTEFAVDGETIKFTVVLKESNERVEVSYNDTVTIEVFK